MQFEYLIYVSFVIYGLGFAFNYFNKHTRVIYLCLFLSAFLIRYFIAAQDPFLHSWDERYHALVGKNLAEHPAVPTLKDDTLFEANNFDWQSAHIWVHKQPVFLYQIAVSIQFLGNTEMAVRMPSVLMGALMVLLLFRIATLTTNKSAAYVASGLFIFSFFQLEQTAGVIGMDHNDIAFAFYFALSIWGYVEFRENKQRRYIYLIAVFTAFGTLTKWLPACAIYGVWLLDILIHDTKNWKTELPGLLKSFGISTVIWGSWQAYIFSRWPREAGFEHAFNRRHFSEALEGHTGSWNYHLNLFDNQYGNFTILLFVIGFLVTMADQSKWKYRVLYIFIPVSTYLVFSIAKTKSFAYVFYISPLIFAMIGYGFYLVVHFLVKHIRGQHIQFGVFGILLLLFCGYHLNTHALYKSHVLGKSDYINNYRNVLQHNTAIYKQLDSVASDCDIIFNCRSLQDIDAEFYSSKTVYSWYPDSTELDHLLQSGYTIGVFQSFAHQQLPDYITRNTSIRLLELNQLTE